MSSGETVNVQPCSATYQWLAHNPLTAAAGNAIAALYEGSKNRCRLANFVLGTAESSVKYAAGTAAPLVKKLETPINAVDEFTFHQLQKLEEKVPAITKPPSTLLSESKEAVTTKVTEGKDAILTQLHTGSEAISNSRAGHFVGNGVHLVGGCALTVTEKLVDYLVPAEVSEKGPVSESAETKELKGEELSPPSTATRVASISRKLKVGIYYPSLRKLQTKQQQCMTALTMLEEHVHVLQCAAKARDVMVAQYHAAQHLVAEVHVSKMWKREDLKAAPASEEVDEDIEWLTPKKKAHVEAALEYAKGLGEVVYSRLQSVSKALTYLPHQLKDSTVQALNYAQEFCTVLKMTKSASELSSTSLSRLSETLRLKISPYCHQLGNYLTDALGMSKSPISNPTLSVEDSGSDEAPKDEDEGKEESEEEVMDEGHGDDGTHDSQGGDDHAHESQDDSSDDVK